jgi:hypothetical protein
MVGLSQEGDPHTQVRARRLGAVDHLLKIQTKPRKVVEWLRSWLA